LIDISKGDAISLGIETVACLGIGVVYMLLKWRNNKKQELIDQGVTDNGTKGDQELDFKYNL
jgi:hypothetical protein